jgi:glucose/arabinose dehydrogenase
MSTSNTTFNATCVYTIESAIVPDGFCVYHELIQVYEPLTIISTAHDEVVLLEKGRPSVTVLSDYIRDGFLDISKPYAYLFGLAGGLTMHAIPGEYFGLYLYTSTDDRVFRWTFTRIAVETDRNARWTLQDNEPDLVVTLNASLYGGDQRINAIKVDPSFEYLYVSVGPNDKNQSADATLRRFLLETMYNDTNLPMQFVDGQVVADGIYNTTGLAFDKHGFLWGIDSLPVSMSSQDYPGDELNRFDVESLSSDASPPHYGYPDCWAEGKLSSNQTDEACGSDYIAPQLVMPGRYSGLVFYKYVTLEQREKLNCPPGGFPPDMDNHAFAGIPSSMNQDGMSRIVRIIMDRDGQPVPGLGPTNLLMDHENLLQPVDLTFDECGRLWVASSGYSNATDNKKSSMVIRIDYNGKIDESVLTQEESYNISGTSSVSKNETASTSGASTAGPEPTLASNSASSSAATPTLGPTLDDSSNSSNNTAGGGSGCMSTHTNGMNVMLWIWLALYTVRRVILHRD